MSDSYIPALRFHALTRLFDPVMASLFAETSLRQRLIGQARLEPGQRVLDLGCGTGSLLIAIKEQWPSIQAVGLDADSGVLEIARRKAVRAGVSIELVHRSSSEPGLPDASFDRVLSSLFFHHLTRESKLRTLGCARALLAPGGELHLMDWGKPTNRLMRTLFRVVEIVDGRETTADNVEGRMLPLLTEAGFGAHATGHVDTVLGTIGYWMGRRDPDPV
jgi:ubiquinone/menaquinone biosynthesis C-methylase UbiE